MHYKFSVFGEFCHPTYSAHISINFGIQKHKNNIQQGVFTRVRVALMPSVNFPTKITPDLIDDGGETHMSEKVKKWRVKVSYR